MRRLLPVSWLIVMVIAACGSADDAGGDPASTTPTTVATTTTTAVTSTTTADEELEVARTADLSYQGSVEGRADPVVDVYAPVDDGPWPVVITYHPDMAVNDKTSMSRLAEHLAEQGAVVFNPTYGMQGRTVEALRFHEGGQVACSYWYAYENAAAYGGDSDDITLVGFSGGANAVALLVTATPDSAEGCAVEPVPVDPKAAVLFEGDFTLARFWDTVLAEDPDVFEDATVWAYIDDYDGPPLRFLLDTQTTTASTYQVPADAVDGYLALRSSADMQPDLETIGALDDGQLDLTEASELFHYRLEQAGASSTVTWIDASPHIISTVAIEAITELVFGEPDQ